jgi:hypothetical protein
MKKLDSFRLKIFNHSLMAVTLILVTLIVRVSLAQIQFEDVSIAAGITNTSKSFGVSWGDFNADGKPDVWVSNHASKPSLYLNNGDGTFTDIATEILFVNFYADTHGASWADFDNDGDQDLLQLVGAQAGAGAGPNQLFLNYGGILQDRAAEYGLEYSLGRGRTPLWFDWNKDGYLDVFLANKTRLDAQAPSALFTQADNFFRNDNETAEINLVTPFYSQVAALFGDRTWLLIPHRTTYPNKVYTYDTIPFTDILNSINLPLTTNVRDSAIVDFNGDLQPDFYLTRSVYYNSEVLQTEPNTIKVSILVFKDEKGLRFHTSGQVSFQFEPNWVLDQSEVFIGSEGVNPESLIFSLSPADHTTVGILEHEPGDTCCIFIGYDPGLQIWEVYVSKDKWLHVNVIIESSEPISDAETVGFDSYDGSLTDRLIIQNDGVFYDATAGAGLDMETASGSVVAGDFDNDMDMDLYLVCRGNIINKPNLLYENLGDGKFSLASAAGGASGSDEGRGDSAALADFDEDGFLDIFVTNGRGAPPFHFGPHQLLRNLGNTNQWLEIDLEGVISNRDGIGTYLLATAGGVTQLRQQTGGIHRSSQNHQRVHFCLRNNNKVDKLSLRWPSGIKQEINNLPANQIIRIIEPSNPFIFGMPEYQPGGKSGVFIWKETFDGSYHLRVNGEGPEVKFDINLLSDHPLIEAEPYSLEGGDKFSLEEAAFSLHSEVSVWHDGVDFKLEPGAKAILSVEKDGLANPRQTHVGAEDKPLAPAGWILPLNYFSWRPSLQGGIDLGLFIGQNFSKNRFEARWNGDGKVHSMKLKLMSSVPIVVTPVSFEHDDAMTTTLYFADISAYVSTWWDGVNLEFLGDEENASIGVIYRQDTLFQPHWVNPNNGGLGMPNAYLLPLAGPYEKPDYNPDKEDGIFLWKDKDGGWHLRAVAGRSGWRRYGGKIISDMPFIKISPVELEPNDTLGTSDPQVIVFDINMGRHWYDGIDFDFPPEATITLDLQNPSQGGDDLILIGKDRWPISNLPLDISGW